MIQINLNKAIDIRKDQLRTDRAPLMSALDIELMKANETQDVDRAAEIVAEKVRLRDITNLADACTSVEELMTIKADSALLEENQ